ncbi:ribbon-helix-helix domain-containing protein [Methanospirillum purgamenti]|jgi:hypothetical protein|uniref:Ribbon-helix-helix domain-containing protein n=1 Tax=Methanospirillum hungatei TaxID=2203 RepID=A0A8F5ZFI7_METHU|nr:CopG family transcriptional regulator [Methanospirillum hungatei]QXO95560.1 ribbon-helix-helix domain-containing protein [Methanospirillum hungatei]
MRGRFNITLSEAINDQLDRHAKDHDMTRSSVIEVALKDYLGGLKNTQIIHNDDLRSEVDNLTHRMQVIEEKFASMTPTKIITEAHEAPIEPEPIISFDQDHIPNSDPPLNHNEWYRQKDVAEMLPDSMNINTRKSKVSKAVASGELKTNGKKGNECLIKGTSVIDWLKYLLNYQNDPSKTTHTNHHTCE